MKNSQNLPIVLSIIFATVAVSGSLVFLGLQLTKTAAPVNIGLDQTAIEKGIEAYIAKQNTDQQNAQQAQEQVAEVQAKNVVPIKPEDHVRGNKDALITLFEYSDFECPFCKRFHPTSKEFLEKNSDTINWVYRHFPLGFHDPLATAEAEASECAGELGGNDKFWEYTDKVYETTNSNGKGMKEEQLVTIAENLGLDKQKFVSCIESDKYLEHIQQDIAEGTAAGVTGTPGNILRNNETGEVRFIPGAYPISALEQAMNELL